MSIKGFVAKNGAVGAKFDDVYFIDGARTPFGKMKGTLSTITPTDLSLIATKSLFHKSKIDPKDVDQIIATNIGQSSADTFYLPRHVGLYSGVPLNRPALFSHRLCGSGMEIIGQAAEQIALGKGDVILTAGAETMSLMPLVSFSARRGFDLGRPEFIDMLWEALIDSAAVPMGKTADNLASRYKLTREEVDEFALESQNRYFTALEQGFFAGEVCTVPGKGEFIAEGLNPRKFKTLTRKELGVDEHPRKSELAKMASLPAIFSKEGPTTAANASGIVDGGCASLIASGSWVKKKNLTPLGKILGHASVGVDPHCMGIGPADAIRGLLEETGVSINDIDYFEVNEAFSAQALSVAKELKLDLNKLNVHGGAISLGHPLSATGLRLVTTLLYTLKRQNKRLGIASACIGGGQGIAVLVEAS